MINRTILLMFVCDWILLSKNHKQYIWGDDVLKNICACWERNQQQEQYYHILDGRQWKRTNSQKKNKIHIKN